MGRRRKGLAIDGWLVLDKPRGLTSTDAVTRVRRLFGAAKAGHAGTLDPLATGVLPIALGEATKTVPFAVEGTKVYRFTVRFGVETDTDDAEGKVTARSDLLPSRAEVEQALQQFVGMISQVPPRYSAIKVDGARAYELARDEQDFELSARDVHIARLVLTDMPDAETCVIEAECGKGTYVRALARDLGRALETFAHVEALRRTRVGPFGEADAVPLASLEQAARAEAGSGALLTMLAPVEAALADLPQLAVSNADAARLRQGQPVLLRGRDAPVLSGPAYAVSRGVIVALGEVDQGALKPRRIFNVTATAPAPALNQEEA